MSSHDLDYEAEGVREKRALVYTSPISVVMMIYNCAANVISLVWMLINKKTRAEQNTKE